MASSQKRIVFHAVRARALRQRNLSLSNTYRLVPTTLQASSRRFQCLSRRKPSAWHCMSVVPVCALRPTTPGSMGQGFVHRWTPPPPASHSYVKSDLAAVKCYLWGKRGAPLFPRFSWNGTNENERGTHENSPKDHAFSGRGKNP